MESWQMVWREGFAPLLSGPALEALAGALERDDPQIIQGATVHPPPLQCVRDWPVEAADALAYGLWKGDGPATVEELETAWARLCFDCDNRLGESAGCRWFLNWYDATPRAEMIAALLPEVRLALEQKRQPKVEVPAAAGAAEF